MPNDNLTDITFILDRSSSMARLAEATVMGFSKFVEEQRATKGDAVMTLVQFADEWKVDYAAKSIKDVPRLSYRPHGNTALYDAVASAILRLGERLSMTPEAERPGKVVFVIMTDGEENASREFAANHGGAKRLQEMIKHQEEKYNWLFIFLGANIDSERAAAAIGISADKSVQYSADVRGTEGVMGGVTRGVGTYRSATRGGTDHKLMAANFKGRAMAKSDVAEIDAALIASGADPNLLNNKGSSKPSSGK